MDKREISYLVLSEITFLYIFFYGKEGRKSPRGNVIFKRKHFFYLHFPYDFFLFFFCGGFLSALELT